PRQPGTAPVSLAVLNPKGCSASLDRSSRQDLRKLSLEEPSIRTIDFDQFPMSPLLKDATLAQDHDLIGALHGRQLMRNDDYRLVLHQTLQRLHHRRRRVGIEPGEGLVQNDNGSIADD